MSQQSNLDVFSSQQTFLPSLSNIHVGRATMFVIRASVRKAFYTMGLLQLSHAQGLYISRFHILPASQSSRRSFLSIETLVFRHMSTLARPTLTRPRVWGIRDSLVGESP